VGHVSNVPEKNGTLETCPTSDRGARFRRAKTTSSHVKQPIRRRMNPLESGGPRGERSQARGGHQPAHFSLLERVKFGQLPHIYGIHHTVLLSRRTQSPSRKQGHEKPRGHDRKFRARRKPSPRGGRSWTVLVRFANDGRLGSEYPSFAERTRTFQNRLGCYDRSPIDKTTAQKCVARMGMNR